MKRFLLLIPFVLLVINACAEVPATIPPSQGTAVALTQTASVWTPTWTPTPDPPENKIVEWLNGELSKADALEQTLDARYLVTGVSFPFAPGSSAQIFRVDLRCECASSTNCCVPERMFVVLMTAMKGSKDKIIKQVPSNVGTLKVICYDHISQTNVIGTDWAEVKGYLDENVSGYELGALVSRTTFP